ncbi:aldose 1-epimerase [Strigomonas culicis]|nr:aldose 1-epimerase [Strigomonas culicis]|eukprot:EPY36090.1 aldose 1-epimerase [Strigomonas culicis]
MSPHNENGFPGELHCMVTYTIFQKQPHALCMDFRAALAPASPANATIVNMFNHAYWNLNGFPKRPLTLSQSQPAAGSAADAPWPQAAPIHNHHLRLPTADTVAETDAAAIPSGKMVSVAGSPLDFRGAGHCLGDGIDNEAALRRQPCGYDHPFFMSDYKMPGQLHSRRQPKRMSLNAVMRSPTSGIEMSVYSTFPCLWVYTANNLKADAKGTLGERFARYRACCLEPQHLPDAINHTKTFPRTSFIVTKKNPYIERIVNVFTVRPHAGQPRTQKGKVADKEGEREAARATSLLPHYLSKL